jgi:hypothetical protein
MALYLIPNSAAMVTDSTPQLSVTTGTAIKTMLQFKASGTIAAKIIEWGISFDGSAAATPGKVELVEHDTAATVTAHVAAGIVKYDNDALGGGDPTTNLILVGTTATGFTSTGEGTSATVSRILDVQYIAGTNQYVKQFPLGREPVCRPGTFFTKVRVTFGSAVNCYCYIIVSI